LSRRLPALPHRGPASTWNGVRALCGKLARPLGMEQSADHPSIRARRDPGHYEVHLLSELATIWDALRPRANRPWRTRFLNPTFVELAELRPPCLNHPIAQSQAQPMENDHARTITESSRLDLNQSPIPVGLGAIARKDNARSDATSFSWADPARGGHPRPSYPGPL